MSARMMIGAALAVGACGGVDPKMADAPDVPVDASADGAPADAASRCDPATMFGAPVLVDGLNTPAEEATVRLSPDELTAYFARRTAGGGRDLFVASRTTRATPFAGVAPLSALNSTAQDQAPSVSRDGLLIVFTSNPVPMQGAHLYLATRPSTLADFGAPSLVAGVNSSTVTDSDVDGFLTADRDELWFASNRAGTAGALDLWRAARVGSGFGPPARVVELSSPFEDDTPIVSADRLTVYFSSPRPGGAGSFDVWSSHRSSVTDAFPPPSPVASINSPAIEELGWISDDDCRLYFASDRAGSRDLYVAERRPQ